MSTATAESTITEAQRQQFDEQGYIILHGVISPEQVEAARREVDILVDEEARKLIDEGLIEDPLQNEPFETRLLRLYSNHMDKAPNQFREQLQMSGLFPIFFNEKVLDLAEAFLGPEIRLYPNYTIRPKLPDHAASLVLWHQDGAYTAYNSAEAQGGEVNDLRMINVWSPLVPARRENGCMQFVPGTHKLGVVEHEHKEFYLEIADHVLKPRLAEAVDVVLDPGDVVLFSNLLFHCGLPNHTDTIRWSLDWRYQDAAQDTLRKEKGHIARSRRNPASAVQSAEAWGNARWQ